MLCLQFHQPQKNKIRHCYTMSKCIEAVFPKTEIQQCIIHQIRNTTKYVSYKDIKAFMADLNRVYAAVDEDTALQ